MFDLAISQSLIARFLDWGGDVSGQPSGRPRLNGNGQVVMTEPASVAHPPRANIGKRRMTSAGKRLAATSQVAERFLASGFPVLETKLVSPPPRAGLLRRAALIDRLTTSREVPIVAVLAPAGYGKSTVLAQWAESDPASCLGVHRRTG